MLCMQVAPAELEYLLHSHPEVADVAVAPYVTVFLLLYELVYVVWMHLSIARVYV